MTYHDKAGGAGRWRLGCLRTAVALLILLIAAGSPLAEEPRQLDDVKEQSPPGAGDDRQLPPPRDPELLISRFDRDGDGSLGRNEAPEGLLTEWEEADGNRDGKVSLEELKAFGARKRAGVGSADGGMPGASDEHRRPSAAGGEGKARRFSPGGVFSVLTVGTGSPQFNPQRSGPSALIQYRGQLFLVDMGNGTQARLAEAGISPRQISALLLTHHHLDHNEEFIPLFINTRLVGAKPDIIGPPQTRKLVEFITSFYADDIAYRLARTGMAQDAFRTVAVREVKGSDDLTLAGMRVTTAAVNHTIHTVAYRFEAEGRAIVISGDLSYSDSLVELARNADVLVIDGGGATKRKGEGEGPPPPGAAAPRPAEGTGDPFKAHSNLQEVATMARKAGVKRLVLTHIGPGAVDEEATVRALSQTFKGEIFVGRDLLETVAIAATPAQPISSTPP